MIWCPPPSTSSITIRQCTSSRPGGVSEPLSSPAMLIDRQPPCAAASNSSGLVFPSRCAMRVASEYPRSANAPLPAVSSPAPRARFPSQTTSAVRSIRGTVLPLLRDGGRRSVRVIGLGRRTGGAEDAEHLHHAGAVVLEAMHEACGQVDGRAGAKRRRLTADVKRARALEDVDDLVVLVEVVGRAAHGDV